MSGEEFMFGPGEVSASVVGGSSDFAVQTAQVALGSGAQSVSSSSMEASNSLPSLVEGQERFV